MVKSSNWRDNCVYCPVFEECKSQRSEEECESFLNKKMIESICKYLFKNK